MAPLLCRDLNRPDPLLVIDTVILSILAPDSSIGLAHAEIVLQNPTEFDMFDRVSAGAPAAFFDEGENDGAAGSLAVKSATDADRQEPPRLVGMIANSRDQLRQAERQNLAAEIGSNLMQIGQDDAEGLRCAVELDDEAAVRLQAG